MQLMLLLSIVGAIAMRAGFAIQAAGMVRSKNSAAAICRHLCDLCIAILGFWAVGMAIMAGGGSFFWMAPELIMGWETNATNAAFPLVAGVLIATAIVPGVLAERARFWPALWTGLALSTIVIPVIGAWAAGGTGFLANLKLLDLLGATTIHWPGAVAATVAALFVGARTGKFNRDGSSTAIPGHSVPLAGAGLFILLFGWMMWGGLGALRPLLLAGAAGGMASLILSQVRYYKPDLHLISAGLLGALVAASAGGATLSSVGAVITGGVAGVLVPMAILIIDVRFRIDDPSGGIAIHGIGAAWGALSAPFLNVASFDFVDRLKSLGANSLALVLAGALSAGVSFALWTVLKKTTPLKVKEHDEFDGLDLAEHDIGAYPDFQQNTIKSYHLREV